MTGGVWCQGCCPVGWTAAQHVLELCNQRSNLDQDGWFHYHIGPGALGCVWCSWCLGLLWAPCLQYSKTVESPCPLNCRWEMSWLSPMISVYTEMIQWNQYFILQVLYNIRILSIIRLGSWVHWYMIIHMIIANRNQKEIHTSIQACVSNRYLGNLSHLSPCNMKPRHLKGAEWKVLTFYEKEPIFIII